MSEGQEFKRILFGFSQDGSNERAGRLAAEFAQLLGADLFGLFVQDVSHQIFSELSFVRELRLLESNWAPIDPERLAAEVELDALRASREFIQSAAALRLSPRVEVVKGDPVRMLAEAARAGDIVVLPQDRLVSGMTDRFEELSEAAFAAKAAVMLVPNRVIAGRGPVLAIARHLEEPCVKAARAIAATAKLDLRIIPVGQDENPIAEFEGDAQSLAAFRTRASETTRASKSGSTLARGPQELIIVLSRGIISHRAMAAIASRRRTPILIANEP